MDIKEFARRGTDFSHIGFCMGSFNTGVCCDCPSLKDCLTMYGRDVAMASIRRVLDLMELEGYAVDNSDYYD